MNDEINNPKHYENAFPSKGLECIDLTRFCDFCTGNAIKYVWRAGKKDDPIKDLEKACWYIEAEELDINVKALDIFLFATRCPEDELEMKRWQAIYFILNGQGSQAESMIAKMLELFNERKHTEETETKNEN